jgi:hypothetical protein
MIKEMIEQIACSPKTDCKLKQRIIELHDKGYELDFRIIEGEKIACLQDSTEFDISDISIKIIDQGFDCLSYVYKYIPTVDSGC